MTKTYRIKIRFQGHEYLSAESFVTFDQAQKEGERRFARSCVKAQGGDATQQSSQSGLSAESPRPVEWMAVTIEREEEHGTSN